MRREGYFVAPDPRNFLRHRVERATDPRKNGYAILCLHDDNYTKVRRYHLGREAPI